MFNGVIGADWFDVKVSLPHSLSSFSTASPPTDREGSPHPTGAAEAAGEPGSQEGRGHLAERGGTEQVVRRAQGDAGSEVCRPPHEEIVSGGLQH